MSTGFLGEIRTFPVDAVPDRWRVCDGSLLEIGDFQALFSLLGNAYGGDGRRTFGIPDLRGRVPRGGKFDGGEFLVGRHGGSEAEALDVTHMPVHRHAFAVTSAIGTSSSASEAFYASVASGPAGSNTNLYGPLDELQPLESDYMKPSGSGEPHNNMQPFTVVRYCICVRGIFPSRP